MLSSEELSRRRRVVYHAVREHVPEATVRLAVRLCDAEFGRDPAFSVVRFVDKLAGADATAAAARPALFAALQRVRLLDPAALAPDPLAGGTGVVSATAVTPMPAARTAAPAAADGWHTVFNALTAELFSALRARAAGLPAAALAHLGGAALELGLAEGAAAELLAWLRSGSPAFTARSSRRDLHAIAHSLYTWACEEVGPVDADRLFARALREAEKHPSAARFPPPALL